MFTLFDHATISSILSDAFAVVTGYGLNCAKEERVLLRDYVHKIVFSKSINELTPPDTLPLFIREAVKEITIYLYSTDPKIDFYSCPSSLTEEGFKNGIQPYIRNMLNSIIYYLNDDPNTQPPEISKNIDLHIKRILKPEAHSQKKKNKPLPSFQEAIKQVNAVLNDEQNITVYQSITGAVDGLKNLNLELQDMANDPQRVMLAQRLSLLEYMDGNRFEHYQLKNPAERQKQIQERLRRQAPRAQNLFLPHISITTVLMILAVSAIALSYTNFFSQPQLQKEKPVWPSGMLDLQNNAVKFAWMDRNSVTIMNFEAVAFPFAPHHLLQFNAARSSAKHEDVSIGIHQTMNKMDQLLQSKSALFIECYGYLWAFLVEHGRGIAHGASLGGRFSLTADEQLEIRALEALRVGLEQLFKSAYPDYAKALSCLKENTYSSQTIALDEMITSERQTGVSLYKERNQLLRDWYEILDQHKIPHWPMQDKTIKPNTNSLMHAAMTDAMCPWWQTPLKYIMNTAGGIQQMLCAQWRASAKHMPAESAEKTLEKKGTHRFI